MFEWVRRDTLVDVTINAVPVVVLVYFALLTATQSAWQETSVTAFMAHSLTLFPIIVLVVATYVVALAVETDIQGLYGHVGDRAPSPYTPSGSFVYLLIALLVTLVGAIVFLLVFTSASLPW